MVCLFFVIQAVNNEHGDINMRILHTGVFPVCKLDFFFSLIIPIKQEIVRHCIDMGQADVFLLLLDIVFQLQYMLFCLPVIPIDRWSVSPQGFIDLDLAEHIKTVLHFQIHIVKLFQFLHADPEILIVFRITDPNTFQKSRDLISIHRIDIHRIITQSASFDGLVNICLMLPVDQFIRTLSRNTHDIFFPFYRKQERPVGHTFFQHADIRDLLFLAVHRCSDGPDGV